MKNILAMVAVAVMIMAAVAGCAEITAFRSGIAKHGADASDQVLESALWTICNGSPVGAVKRRFKTASEQDAYNVMCSNLVEVPLESIPVQ